MGERVSTDPGPGSHFGCEYSAGRSLQKVGLELISIITWVMAVIWRSHPALPPWSSTPCSILYVQVLAQGWQLGQGLSSS